MKINVHYRARCESAHSAYSVFRKGAELFLLTSLRHFKGAHGCWSTLIYAFWNISEDENTDSLRFFEKFHELRTYQERRKAFGIAFLEQSLRNIVMRDIILALIDLFSKSNYELDFFIPYIISYNLYVIIFLKYFATRYLEFFVPVLFSYGTISDPKSESTNPLCMTVHVGLNDSSLLEDRPLWM